MQMLECSLSGFLSQASRVPEGQGEGRCNILVRRFFLHDDAQFK